MLAAEDVAKRQIARDLHDVTAQNLLCASLAVQRAASLPTTADGQALLVEAAELIMRSQGEIRTLAYLLHPPMLDEAGLFTALRWFAAGLARKAQLEITLKLDPALERLPLSINVGTSLFRVVQEALSNVYRHSGSATANVEIVGDPLKAGCLVLTVEDDGCGLPPLSAASQAGVGVAGMAERMGLIGGTLEICDRNGEGTSVVARVKPAGWANGGDVSRSIN